LLRPADTLSAYGHSWVFGTGSSRRDRGFSALTARVLRLRHDDRAVSGSLSMETARIVASNPPPPASLFLLMTGLNDARLNGHAPAAREAYADALALLFRAFHQASPAAAVLALEQPYVRDYTGYEPFHRASDAVIDAYNATLRQAASRHSCARVVAIKGWEVDTMVSADGVHPNDAGHWHLAQAVIRAVRAPEIEDISPAGQPTRRLRPGVPQRDLALPDGPPGDRDRRRDPTDQA
jgi:lysophospholipase L1-like esterase